MPELRFAETGERDDLGAFVARAVRLEPGCVIRLHRRDDRALLDAWAATPFDVLATRSVRGTLRPADVTVSGNELLAALTVARGDRIDPGPPLDLMWRSPLPATTGWRTVDTLPVPVVSELADRGLEVARSNQGPHGTPPASLLDQEVLTVEGAGMQLKVPLRCLFALSGMGFLATGGTVEVSGSESWLRIDARFGAVARRRHALLPLLF